MLRKIQYTFVFLLLIFACLACSADEQYTEENVDAVTSVKTMNDLFVFFAADREQANKRGVFSISNSDVRPQPISDEIVAAIKENPGLMTGADFDQSLAITKDCSLFGLTVPLSTKPDLKQWLVAPLPPCGKSLRKDFPSPRVNTPFWFVEQKSNEKPRILLAYRAYMLSLLLKPKYTHDGYADISSTHLAIDGNDIDIDWRYQDVKYRYKSSVCSNLSPINADEPAFVTDCARVEAW